MAIEIERKFLVHTDEWRKYAEDSKDLRQGYLSTNFLEWIVRVRIINHKSSFVCMKKASGSISSHEYEYEIPLKDAEAIWDLLEYKVIKKSKAYSYER